MQRLGLLLLTLVTVGLRLPTTFATDAAPCPGGHTLEECLALAETCLGECEKGSGTGAGFCAAFSSFFNSLVPAIMTANNNNPVLVQLVTSLFTAPSYYCTSGAPYLACDYCGNGLELSHVYTTQKDTLVTTEQLRLAALEGQKVAYTATKRMTETMEDIRVNVSTDLSFGQLYQDFDNLNFKFDLISLNADGSNHQDFAFRHFLESAQVEGKENIFGVYRRIMNLMLGQKRSANFYNRRKKNMSVFLRDRQTFCDSQIVSLLYLVLFKVREMTYFVLRNDKKTFRTLDEFRRHQIRSARDQSLVDMHVQRVCMVSPKVNNTTSNSTIIQRKNSTLLSTKLFE